jgi:hypothetical protein
VSTVPQNGDVNPYGVAFVPTGFPATAAASAGDILVANFNNGSNAQGTGSTIVRIRATAPQQTLFYADATPANIGFSTALGVLRAGFVVLGNVPSSDGSGMCQPPLGANVGQGSLTFIDASGNFVMRYADPAFVNGPWDLTVFDSGATAKIFVSNVLTGTVTRLDLTIGASIAIAATQIASGYPHDCDPAAFVVGPTGLAYDPGADVLYVASTVDNAIFTVAQAGTSSADRGRGTLFSQINQFHGPLGLALSNGGTLISAQGDAIAPAAAHPSTIVEIQSNGTFVSRFSIDPAPGSAFGLALDQSGAQSRFAAVDDGTNVLDVWQF